MKKLLVFLLTLALCLPALSLGEEAILQVSICPLVRADAILLTQGDVALLVDTGEATDADTLAQLLEARGITRLDMVVNTHPHHDHLGGLPALLEKVQVEQFITGFDEGITGKGVVQKDAVAALKKKDIPIQHVDHGDVLQVGSIRLTVLRRNDLTSMNDRSLMLMVEYGACRMLLTGDVTAKAQKLFVQEGCDLKADILKAPHHGREKMYASFLTGVAPDFVFITNNSSDSKDVRSQLSKKSIPYQITREGFIYLRCNGQDWERVIPIEKKNSSV